MFDWLKNWVTLVIETIRYIRTYGWAEYRAARQRYDKHQEAVKNQQAKYTRKGEIAMRKAAEKMRKR